MYFFIIATYLHTIVSWLFVHDQCSLVACECPLDLLLNSCRPLQVNSQGEKLRESQRLQELQVREGVPTHTTLGPWIVIDLGIQLSLLDEVTRVLSIYVNRMWCQRISAFPALRFFKMNLGYCNSQPSPPGNSSRTLPVRFSNSKIFFQLFLGLKYQYLVSGRGC